jgi:hypothetical protein
MRTSREGGDPARLVVDRPSEYDFTLALVKKLPFPFNDRELVSRQVCYTDDSGRVVIAFGPPEVDVKVDYGKKMSAVRAVTVGFLRFTPLEGRNRCQLELYQRVDAGGRIPVFVVNRKSGESAAFVADMREDFERDDEIDAAELDEVAAVIRSVLIHPYLTHRQAFNPPPHSPPLSCAEQRTSTTSPKRSSTWSASATTSTRSRPHPS